MQCLRCGREIAMGQVFCQDCLANMEKYPVKPGTPVQIPKRQEAASAKKQPLRRSQAAPEVQVMRLKRRLWIVSALLALVVVLGGVAGWFAMDYIMEKEGLPLPGQNYSSVTSTALAEPSEP